MVNEKDVREAQIKRVKEILNKLKEGVTPLTYKDKRRMSKIRTAIKKNSAK